MFLHIRIVLIDNFNKDFWRGILALLGLMIGKYMEIVSHVRGGGDIPNVYNELGYNTINTNVILHHHYHYYYHHYYN
jgi:hypothetical protein